MLGITLLIPSTKYLTLLDELSSFTLLGIALFDAFFTGNFRKYKLLWILIAIFTFYAIYSITSLDYNSAKYILIDWIIELKPYIPFAVFIAIGPQFTEKNKRYIRIVCIINMAILTICFLLGIRAIQLAVSHPAYATQDCLVCAAFYFYCSRDNETGAISKQNIWIAVLMLAVGFLGFKAKYFATAIPAIYLILFYKPGIMRNFSIKHVVVMIAIGVSILAATWSKIQYYFLTGTSDKFDAESVQSFARPALYITGVNILVDHFPFGTGLASFATYPSAESYSMVYYEYGINKVHGISPRSEVCFIMDAFFPSLAQYGVAGIILYIAFWIYVYSFLRILVRTNPQFYRAQFITGSMIIIFILAESVAATTFTQTSGMITMSLLGMSCAFGKRLKVQQNKINLSRIVLTRKI